MLLTCQRTTHGQDSRTNSLIDVEDSVKYKKHHGQKPKLTFRKEKRNGHASILTTKSWSNITSVKDYTCRTENRCEKKKPSSLFYTPMRGRAKSVPEKHTRSEKKKEKKNHNTINNW